MRTCSWTTLALHVKYMYIMCGNARKLAKSNSGTLLPIINARSLPGDDPEGILILF